MIHRILVAENADKVGIAAYKNGLCYKDLPPMDLQPFFPNCVRVFSNLDVISIEDQDKFDAQLTELGESFGGVAVRHDVGAYLGVIGRPLISPDSSQQ